MTIRIEPFFDPATNTLTYLIVEPATGAAAIIDPVLDFDPKAARIATTSADAVLAAAAGLDILWVLETHAHADHLSAADYIRGRTGAQVVIGAPIAQVQERFGAMFETVASTGVFDRLVEDGDRLPLGAVEISVIATPGHTPACVTYHVEDALFVGDTLFMPDYGTARADFPGGDAATLYRSIRRLLDLPPSTRIFVGHDYLPPGRTESQWETTVSRQRAENVHLRDGVSEEQFVAMRQARDKTLAAPTLILPALQVNIQAGRLPPPTEAGRVFLKLPVNAI